MDPESGLDDVRHVGIRGDTIEAVSPTPLAGARVIDASRRVVAPGFIDLHEHGQQEEAYRMMVRDGVTSVFELEWTRAMWPDGTPRVKGGRSSTTAFRSGTFRRV
jgi:cytosine/adenosine deaminase-related metal-dependent hydrolase